MKRKTLLALGLLLLAGSGAGILVKANAAGPAARPGVVLETTSLDIDFSRQAVTFIQIGATGCFRCELMQPVLEDLAQEYPNDLLIVHYDAAVDSRPAAHYRVQFLPTQIFIDGDGREFHRHDGYYSQEQIRKVLDGRGLQRIGAGP